jgi:hypothetical protein
MPEVREQRSEVSKPTFFAIADGETLLTAHCTLPTETADCPLCNQALPVSAFGIVSNRKSGRNLYCKDCINKKVASARKLYREYDQVARVRDQRALVQPAAPVFTPKRDANGILLGAEIRNPRQAHHERVLGAIHAGARTRQEIVRAIRPSHLKPLLETDNGSHYQAALEQVGDSLAVLLLGHPKRIKTQAVGDDRQYFAIAAACAERAA